jgi:DNA invertase Pin-like site-specific DNA recombinase
VFLHQQGIDTSTAAGNAFFQMLGVFAEFERAIIVGRVNAGIARAKLRRREQSLARRSGALH